MKDDRVDLHFKVKRTIKPQSRKVFDDLGTNMTDAIQKAIPFEIRIPNQTTINALEEAEIKHTSLKAYTSAQAMFKDLG